MRLQELQYLLFMIWYMSLRLSVVILLLFKLGSHRGLYLHACVAHRVCVEDVLAVRLCLRLTVFVWLRLFKFSSESLSGHLVPNWVISVMMIKCCLSIFVSWMGQRTCFIGLRSTVQANCGRIQAATTSQLPEFAYFLFGPFWAEGPRKNNCCLLHYSHCRHTC